MEGVDANLWKVLIKDNIYLFEIMKQNVNRLFVRIVVSDAFGFALYSVCF